MLLVSLSLCRWTVWSSLSPAVAIFMCDAGCCSSCDAGCCSVLCDAVVLHSPHHVTTLLALCPHHVTMLLALCPHHVTTLLALCPHHVTMLLALCPHHVTMLLALCPHHVTTLLALCPQASAPKLRILHLSDLHLDFWYERGANAECGEPACCRRDDTKPHSE